MTNMRINKWVLRYYKPLTNETILAAMDEIEAHISGTKNRRIFSSIDEAYALATRFKGVLYRPFLKQKPLRILRAIVDRCGEAYFKKDIEKLYISREIIDEWGMAFQISQEKIFNYLIPLLKLGILEPSDRPSYVYKVKSRFFQLVGPVAQYLVQPVEPRKFREMMEVTSGLVSIYVVTHAVKSSGYGYAEEGPRIPWFLKLSLIYTLSGLEPENMKIRDILELERINYVDNYFVYERNVPVELWRSIRTEAFEFMIDNKIIEDITFNGYKINVLWTKICEEGVRRYVVRLRERHRKFLRQ
jgi:hypothetical protein